MRKGLLALGIVGVVVLAVAAYLLLSGSSGGSGSTTVVTDPQTINSTVSGFVRNPFKDDYGSMRLAGYLDNLSDKTVVVADIELQLTDRDGNRKELVKYTIHDIPPNSRKTYDANAGIIKDARDVTIKVVRLEVAD